MISTAPLAWAESASASDCRLKASNVARRGGERWHVAPCSCTALQGHRRQRGSLGQIGSRCRQRRAEGARSGRIEAQADFILGLYEAEPDITLKEILAKLVEERDERFGIATLSRFFKRRGITFKKRPRTRASKIMRSRRSTDRG